MISKVSQYWVEDPLRTISQPVRFTVSSDDSSNLAVGERLGIGFIRNARMMNTGNLPVFQYKTVTGSGSQLLYSRIYDKESVVVSIPSVSGKEIIEEEIEAYTTVELVPVIGLYDISDPARFMGYAVYTTKAWDSVRYVILLDTPIIDIPGKPSSSIAVPSIYYISGSSTVESIEIIGNLVSYRSDYSEGLIEENEDEDMIYTYDYVLVPVSSGGEIIYIPQRTTVGTDYTYRYSRSGSHEHSYIRKMSGNVYCTYFVSGDTYILSTRSLRSMNPPEMYPASGQSEYTRTENTVESGSLLYDMAEASISGSIRYLAVVNDINSKSSQYSQHGTAVYTGYDIIERPMSISYTESYSVDISVDINGRKKIIDSVVGEGDNYYERQSADGSCHIHEYGGNPVYMYSVRSTKEDMSKVVLGLSHKDIDHEKEILGSDVFKVESSIANTDMYCIRLRDRIVPTNLCGRLFTALAKVTTKRIARR